MVSNTSSNGEDSSPSEVELSPTLMLEFKDWPAGLDAPDGAIVMLRKRLGGQITLSASDWETLSAYMRASAADSSPPEAEAIWRAQARRLMQLELTMRGKRDWLAWRLCNWVLRWIGTDWYETRIYQLVSLGILYAEEEKERNEREAAAAGDGS